MLHRLFLLGFLFAPYIHCSCYKFAGKVRSSQQGSLYLSLSNGQSITLSFSDSKYNPRIPKGVLVEGTAIGQKGTWTSNKYSIDILSRDVASSLKNKSSSSNGLYLEKLKDRDVAKCLKSTLKQ